MTNNTKLNAILIEYGVSHQNSINQKIHKICVPIILFSILGLLSLVPGPFHWASYAFIFFGLSYYFQFKNWSVFVVILSQVIPMMLAIHFLEQFNFKIWLSLFLLAWIGQFIGHKIEGKKPSFFQDVFFLLIGPIWILKSFLK